MLRVWIVLVTGILFMACSEETKTRNNLHGKWQLQQIESNGHVEKVDTIYYNFLTSLFEYQIYIPEKDTCIICYGFNYIEDDDQLLLELAGTGIDAFLSSTDWPSYKRMFKIEKLSGKQLILSNDQKQYTFRKF